MYSSEFRHLWLRDRAPRSFMVALPGSQRPIQQFDHLVVLDLVHISATSARRTFDIAWPRRFPLPAQTTDRPSCACFFSCADQRASGRSSPLVWSGPMASLLGTSPVSRYTTPSLASTRSIGRAQYAGSIEAIPGKLDTPAVFSARCTAPSRRRALAICCRGRPRRACPLRSN